MQSSSFHADLHCHSTSSDGSDSPEELIHKAIQIGLCGLSITDHDTIDAYKTALPLASSLNFPLLPGVEFSAFFQQEPVHILGYAFSLNNPSITKLCKKHQERRSSRNVKILSNLRNMGIPITEEELHSFQKGSVGRPHIAMLLVKKGIVKTLQEGFRKYLGEGSAAYETGEKISVEETIENIHQAKGKAILAHPHLLKKKKIVQELINFPFDGIEGYYARFSPSQEEKWITIAQKKQWIITGGSDYHGSIKPDIPLGCSWVDQPTFHFLYETYLTSS